MSTLKFYYNTESRVSERVRYFNTHSLWKESLTIHGIPSEYVWEETHVNADIEAISIISQTLKGVTTKSISSIGLIIDAENTTFSLPENSYGKEVNSFVLCNNTKPIAIISGYEELPVKLLGNTLTINWFNGIERILAFNLSSYIVNNALLYQQRDLEIVVPDIVIDRSNLPVGFSEEYDKTSLKGKNSAFKDISITGKAHPLTGDLVSVSGKAAIGQSLKNILLANTYDRPFSSKDIAGNINAFLFDFADDITNSELKTGISIALNNYEKRISVLDIITDSVPESYSLAVKIIYMIKTTNTTQEFSLILDRA
jgi:phage baseplate assembly protein W